MKLPDARWRHKPGLDRLLKVLGGPDGETRFVGGCVRDTLLELDVSDLDLATRLRPEQVIARLEAAGIKAVPTGLAHGTVTAVINGRPVEVTTLRRDVSTDGRRATVAFTNDWREDAARRDFTINALSADPRSGEVFDYFGGVADLRARRVRFIGEPLTRIAEDHLRILRFFRFHARFGEGGPDPASLEACAARANDLMALSRERIADELLKLLALPSPAATVALMIERAILKPVLPEIASAAGLAALVEAESTAGVAPEAVRRLAALLPADPEVAASVAARLRLSKRLAKRLVSAAARELEAPEVLAYEIGPDEAVDRFLLAGRTDIDLRALETWRRPRLPVSGGDLIAMGLEPGPQVARAMQAIEREWVRSGFEADKHK
ncbi:MAG TPA: CCA tRNA nucleotidyltransferase, partial [Allosphingosinicella sp.]|nr:CCA tRNA nucleotidyltransferase [Allosphingosinicella sp.]